MKPIWVDCDNSPHVPFFMPIIGRLQDLGYRVEVTARDCFQVCGLADLFNLRYRRIGRHYGKNRALKIIGNLYRALQLMPIAARLRPAAALSHGSRAMIVAAGLLKIPTVLMLDYEFTQSVPFLKPDLVIAPEVVAAGARYKNGIRLAKYPGIKEDVYVPFFKPDGGIKGEIGLDDSEIIVTIRPPATEAHYHNPESEALFAEVMNFLGSNDNIRMILLPRNEVRQTAWIKSNWPHLFSTGKALIPERVVDGLNLMWHSDLVISGGGTMNREAAALGVPVYSIFRGRIGAVDKYLSENGRLRLLTSKEDVREKIKVERRTKVDQPKKSTSPALDAIVSAVVNLIEKGKA